MDVAEEVDQSYVFLLTCNRVSSQPLLPLSSLE